MKKLKKATTESEVKTIKSRKKGVLQKNPKTKTSRNPIIIF
jgi:hypothetical protein